MKLEIFSTNSIVLAWILNLMYVTFTMDAFDHMLNDIQFPLNYKKRDFN